MNIRLGRRGTNSLWDVACWSNLSHCIICQISRDKINQLVTHSHTDPLNVWRMQKCPFNRSRIKWNNGIEMDYYNCYCMGPVKFQRYSFFKLFDFWGPSQQNFLYQWRKMLLKVNKWFHIIACSKAMEKRPGARSYSTPYVFDSSITSILLLILMMLPDEKQYVGSVEVMNVWHVEQESWPNVSLSYCVAWSTFCQGIHKSIFPGDFVLIFYCFHKRSKDFFVLNTFRVTFQTS